MYIHQVILEVCCPILVTKVHFEKLTCSFTKLCDPMLEVQFAWQRVQCDSCFATILGRKLIQKRESKWKSTRKEMWTILTLIKEWKNLDFSRDHFLYFTMIRDAYNQHTWRTLLSEGNPKSWRSKVTGKHVFFVLC